MNKQEYIALRQANNADADNKLLYEHYKLRVIDNPISFIEFLRALGQSQIIYESTIHNNMVADSIEWLDAHFNVIFIVVKTKREIEESITLIM